MLADSAVLAMQRAIIKYIEIKTKNLNKAQIGVIDQGKVHLTNGRTLRADPTTDIYYGNGSKVVCIIPDGSNIAAVTGVLA